MNTDSAIEIIKERIKSNTGWQSEDEALVFVVDKIQELEKQLKCKQADIDRLITYADGRDKKLAESVPKSEIKTLLRQARDVSSWVSNNDAYKHLRDELKQLLTPPAKEKQIQRA